VRGLRRCAGAVQPEQGQALREFGRFGKFVADGMCHDADEESSADRSDGRLTGDGEVLERIYKAEAMYRPSPMTLDMIIEAVCLVHGVKEAGPPGERAGE